MPSNFLCILWAIYPEQKKMYLSIFIQHAWVMNIKTVYITQKNRKCYSVHCNLSQSFDILHMFIF